MTALTRSKARKPAASKTASKSETAVQPVAPAPAAAMPDADAVQPAASASADLPADAAKPGSPPKGKLGALVTLLSRPEGATLAQMMEATSWQGHSVRGALAGSLKKKFGYPLSSQKTDGERVYRIVAEAA